MNNDPVVEAMAVLRQRHQETLQEAKRIETAIAALSQLVPGSGPVPQVRIYDPNAMTATRPSVKTMLLTLLRESDRDWSVNEILAEYESRGTPVHGKDPNNALRAAVAEANQQGSIFRTSQGRYKAVEWRYYLEAEMGQMVDVQNETQNET